MRPELVAGLGLAVAVAVSCLVAALFAGAGVPLGLVLYSLSGSAALFAGALWVAHHHDIAGDARRRFARHVLDRS